MSVALITGASSGFGAAIAQTLVQAGYRVIGAARRWQNLEKLHSELGENFYPLLMDVVDLVSVDQALASIPADWSKIDLLVNNAGLALGLEPAHKANFADWQTMINTNVVGLTYLTHQILPQMVAHNAGHIINIGSIAGTYPYPGGNVYGATKAFVQQFSLNLRADLLGTQIKVTNLEPGMAGETEFSQVRFKGDQQKAQAVYQGMQAIEPIDIANTVLWLYQQPPHLNINRLEMMPVTQSFSAFALARK